MAESGILLSSNPNGDVQSKDNDNDVAFIQRISIRCNVFYNTLLGTRPDCIKQFGKNDESFADAPNAISERGQTTTQETPYTTLCD